MKTSDAWNAYYADGSMPWDLQGPSEVLRAAIDLGFLSERERILVPGCGRGHDVLQLAERGHSAIGVDFAPDAIAALREAATTANLTVDAKVADIFSLEASPAGSVDGVWEYTCYCAIPVEDRPRYVALMNHLVRPGGRLLFGVFPQFRTPNEAGEVPEGPPHVVTTDEVRRVFGTEWQVLCATNPKVSPEARRDRETLMVLERR